MDSTEKELQSENRKKEKKTIPVKFARGENKENITISTNNSINLSKEQIIDQAFKSYSQGNFLEAAKYYQHVINQGFSDPRSFLYYGNILNNLGQLKEAEIYTRKAIALNPDFSEAHKNLGGILRGLGKLKEAELSTRKAIEINPDYAIAYLNLGNILFHLGKLKEAETYTRKAIDLNPNHPLAHFHLGNILIHLGQLKEAEIFTRTAIALKPNYPLAHCNLRRILKYSNKLETIDSNVRKSIKGNSDWQTYFIFASYLFDIKEFEHCCENLKKSKSLMPENKSYLIEAALAATYIEKNKLINQSNLKGSEQPKELSNEKFQRLILTRKVEKNLIPYLYNLQNKKISTLESREARYGAGVCSNDLDLFNDCSSIISKLQTDLKDICKKELHKNQIIISDSFFNIFKSGSGALPHNHIDWQDINFELDSNKFSLVYYLEIGDQSGEEPGLLRLYDPEEEILPANGMIVIIDSRKTHSVTYSGDKNRVMIGINFYAF